MMLNASPKAPKTMNETLRPRFGMVLEMKEMWSRCKNVKIPVSQKDGPVEHVSKLGGFTTKKNAP